MARDGDEQKELIDWRDVNFKERKALHSYHFKKKFRFLINLLSRRSYHTNPFFCLFKESKPYQSTVSALLLYSSFSMILNINNESHSEQKGTQYTGV